MSVYTWFRATDSADPLSHRAKRQGPREFMQQTLRESPHLVSDVQVHQLANGGAFLRPANQRDLDRACQIFCDMAVPGLVDMFRESLVAAEYFLAPAFPGIRLQQIPQNVSNKSRRRQTNGAQTLEDELNDLWGADLYADIARLNQFDLELYQRAQSEIRRRLFLVPGLDERLADFDSRCAALASRLPDSVLKEDNKSVNLRAAPEAAI